MQIKVNSTRMHKTVSIMPNGGHAGAEIDVDIPVVEGKLVLVECKREESLLYIHQGYPTIHPYFPKDQGPIKGIGRYFKPIIISETEKIEVSELGLNSHNQIFQYGELSKQLAEKDPSTNYKKILAMPEHFSPKYIQAIVDGKIKDGDKVLVECERDYFHKKSGVGGSDHQYVRDIIKLNSNNHITLHKIEKKTYTEEEVQELITKARYEGMIHIYARLESAAGRMKITIDGKWIELDEYMSSIPSNYKPKI